MQKIWLSSPHMGGNELKYIHEAFDSNWVAPLGPNVNGFEADLEKYIGEGKHVAALSAGTAALHLALIQAGVGPGDVVMCQSMTFSASANPIKYLGAEPVFIDSEADTWNLDPLSLEKAIESEKAKGKSVKAVIAVHLYGMPFKVDEITAICQKHDVMLIEDAAEALGSTYKGQKAGTFGEFGILSFNGNKIITTSGGGALVCTTKEEKDKTIFLSTQARDNAPHYQHSQIGYNYRMSNIVAGIGRGQMEVLDSHVQSRRSMHEFYIEIFSEINEKLKIKGEKLIEILVEPNSDYFSNHWLTAITLPNIIYREGLRLQLERFNIESRPLWKPMHLQPVFADCAYYGNEVAEDLFNRGLCLPSGSNLTDEDRQRIFEAIRRFFQNF
jgi:dTDP-4-amino-4,6-dideoxygalactose transaminase